MAEILRQLLVPGGLVTIITVWWTTSHSPKDSEKTEVSQQRAAESAQIVAASGVEERWQRLFDDATMEYNRKLSDQDRKIDAQTGRIESLEEEARASHFREVLHYEYHTVLRGEIVDLGGHPSPWPQGIDPLKRATKKAD